MTFPDKDNDKRFLGAGDFSPCGEYIILGSMKGSLEIRRSDTGFLSSKWNGVRIRSCVWTENNRIVAADTLNRVKEYFFEKREESRSCSELLFREDEQIISMKIVKDTRSTDRYFSLNAVKYRGIKLWDLFNGTLQKFFFSIKSPSRI